MLLASRHKKRHGFNNFHVVRTIVRRRRTAATGLVLVYGATLLLLGCALPEGDADSTPPDKGNNAGTNRLARETSPYLLSHAHNPVDWYPWGPEALEKA